ncbi:MAG: TetR/AcrR family transcriptional regulator [Pseudomonadota bacterium]
MPQKTTRDVILDSAEEVMSRKGLDRSNISEIARKSGVADSAIYHYFQSKEDLLFSVVEERTVLFLDKLSEHLLGIYDPVSRLTKLIWFHLYHNEIRPDWARLLLLECRSNIGFYRHKSYAMVRKYAGILMSILEDGVKKQVFRDDMNLRLVRDMVFGVLDLETVGWLAAGETTGAVNDIDDIMTLILPMITADHPKVKRGQTDKIQLILTAAEKVFADKGYKKATITEMARLAGVAEGTIYEYFKSKRNLLHSIPERRFREHLNTLEELFEIKHPLRKLRRLIRYHFHLYLNQREFLKVFLLHTQLSSDFYQTQAYEIFRRYIQTLNPILKEGKEQGVFRPNVNNRVFRNLFLGAFSHMALRWFLLYKELKTDKMEEIEEALDLLSMAVSTGSALEQYKLGRYIIDEERPPVFPREEA